MREQRGNGGLYGRGFPLRAVEAEYRSALERAISPRRGFLRKTVILEQFGTVVLASETLFGDFQSVKNMLFCE